MDEEWIARLAAKMEALDHNAHTGCSPSYGDILRDAWVALLEEDHG